jgi:predicted exporter
MMSRRRVATLTVVVITAIGFALAVPHLVFTTKITDFLPDNTANRAAQVAALLADSELSKVMVLDVSGGSPDDLQAAARSLTTYLRAQPDVAFVRGGFTETDVTDTLAFLGAWPATTFLPVSAYDDGAIRTRLGELADRLASPAGMIVRQTAPRDPLGGMWEPLEALKQTRGNAIVDDDGVLLTRDRTHAIVFVETRSSPFDSDAQRAFREVLDGWLHTEPVGIRLETAGTAQYAIASENQIKGDVNRIGIISTVGILAIFLLLFGSIRMILISFVPMLFGSAIAVLACQALFGEIHGITIAFGTSLLGVGLDYVEHYYAHFVLTPEVPAGVTMRQVGPSLALGAATTIIGFVGLGESGLVGLRQMAVFAAIAIVASMVATYWMVPPWMPATYRPPRTLGVVNRAVLALLERMTRHHWGRASRIAIGVVVVASMAIAVRAISFSDNVNMLVDDTGPHVVEDRAVRARLGPESDSFAVVTAATDDALLTAVATTTTELERARAGGLISSFVPLDRLVPSRDQQLARLAAARAAEPRLRAAMTDQGFVVSQFQPYWDSLAVASPKLLTLADVRHSPLAPLLAAWLPAQATPIALIPVANITNLAVLRAAVPSATIVVPAETILELFHGVRIRTVIASLLGLVAIFLLLLGRYRQPRKVLVALAPALIACLATVGVLVALGTPLTILHVMSLLLVVSLGVDFGIFFVDTTASLEEAARTMVSIFTASITTILSFGLLGLSHSPGLAALGVTVTLGVTFSLFACLVLAAIAGPALVSKS